MSLEFGAERRAEVVICGGKEGGGYRTQSGGIAAVVEAGNAASRHAAASATHVECRSDRGIFVDGVSEETKWAGCTIVFEDWRG